MESLSDEKHSLSTMDSDNSPPTTSNTKKRRKNTEESDIDNESRARYNQIRQEIQKGHVLFPRFVMMMPDNEEKSLHKLSSFAIQKGIEGLAGEPKSIKRLRSGDLLKLRLTEDLTPPTFKKLQSLRENPSRFPRIGH